MRREMDEAYIWAASQERTDNGLIEDVSPWPEGENIMVDQVLTVLLTKVNELEQKVNDND